MSLQLTKSNGPDCPGCGCNATTLIGAGERFGRPWARYKCQFCQKQFTNGANPATPEIVNGVTYETTRCKCPKCEAVNPPVTSTRGRIRYHKCENCGQLFKSVANADSDE